MRLLKLAGLPALALALSIGSARPAVAQFNTAVTATDVRDNDANLTLRQMKYVGQMLT